MHSPTTLIASLESFLASRLTRDDATRVRNQLTLLRRTLDAATTNVPTNALAALIATVDAWTPPSDVTATVMVEIGSGTVFAYLDSARLGGAEPLGVPLMLCGVPARDPVGELEDGIVSFRRYEVAGASAGLAAAGAVFERAVRRPR